MPGKIEKAIFTTVGSVPASLIGRKDRESTFYHCGVTVKLVQARLSDKKDRESTFHHCAGLVKLV